MKKKRTKKQISDEARLAISHMKVAEEKKLDPVLYCKYCGKPRQSAIAEMCDECLELKRHMTQGLAGLAIAERLFLECLFENTKSRIGPLGHFLLNLPSKKVS